MKVAPPLEKYYEHTSLDLLMKQINDHVKIQGYAIRHKRSKQSKTNFMMKVVLYCDRGGKYQNENHDHRNIKSKRNKYFFKCIAKLNDNQEDS